LFSCVDESLTEPLVFAMLKAALIC
jgi:hypothetical protein